MGDKQSDGGRHEQESPSQAERDASKTGPSEHQRPGQADREKGEGVEGSKGGSQDSSDRSSTRDSETK